MIRRHDCGVAVAVGDGRRLASVLQELKQDPGRRAAMGASARRLALARYTSERATADWLEMLGMIGATGMTVASR